MELAGRLLRFRITTHTLNPKTLHRKTLHCKVVESTKKARFQSYQRELALSMGFKDIQRAVLAEQFKRLNCGIGCLISPYKINVPSVAKERRAPPLHHRLKYRRFTCLWYNQAFDCNFGSLFFTSCIVRGLIAAEPTGNSSSQRACKIRNESSFQTTCGWPGDWYQRGHTNVTIVLREL